MTLRILLCAEDILSATLARDLLDRVVAERARAEWLRALWGPDHRDTQRAWTGLRPDVWWSDRGACEHAADRAAVPTCVRERETGRRRGFPGPAGLAFRTALLADALRPAVDLLVLAGDTDGHDDPARLRAAGAAAADVSLPFVVAEPTREAEAWVVAGFVPEHDAERARLQSLTRALGFDPTASPERLMSTRTGDPRDAKRVCAALLDAPSVTPHDPRARRCWLDTPLDVLVARGARAGLADYVRAVETVVLPRLGDAPHIEGMKRMR